MLAASVCRIERRSKENEWERGCVPTRSNAGLVQCEERFAMLSAIRELLRVRTPTLRSKLLGDGVGDPEGEALPDLTEGVGGLATDQWIAVVHGED